MIEYEEKRNFVRMDANCRMIFRFIESTQEYTATCINLSGAGILFRCDDGIGLGKALEISLIPKNNITPPLNALVEVVRSESDGHGSFEIAASIKGIKGK